MPHCFTAGAYLFLAAFVASFGQVQSTNPSLNRHSHGEDTPKNLSMITGSNLVDSIMLGEDGTGTISRRAPERCNGLFPVSNIGSSWTTCPGTSTSRTLNDGTLNMQNVMSSPKYTYENAPDGRLSMRARFPRGSYGYKNPKGGFSFYAAGNTNVVLTNAKEATFGYAVWFSEGFDFNRGGKLPGLYGGDSQKVSTSCSGGRQSNECFSVRLMWRQNGQGEFYTYLPNVSANKKLCDFPPSSHCNPEYGDSVGTGSFSFTPGRWNKVAMRVRLNDPGSSNGEIQLFFEGRSVLEAKGLVLTTKESGRIRGIQGQTFFGGSNSDWASPKTQAIYFSDYSVALTQQR